jgi:hypothetical protein
MSEEQARALRAPFPENAIGKLPKPYKKESPKGNCGECGGYHGLPAVHLDYVGHAAATDRLLQVDPTWTWEPFALTPEGLPALDQDGNLWIRLTVAGVTRPGVGDGASMKERIGDAIRNSAMRFGVALDLWAKEDIAEQEEPRQASEDEIAAQELFERLRNTTDAEREALRVLADEHDRKLSVPAFLDANWRYMVEERLAWVSGQALADGLTGGDHESVS